MNGESMATIEHVAAMQRLIRLPPSTQVPQATSLGEAHHDQPQRAPSENPRI